MNIMIQVREATEADLQQICELFHTCYGEHYIHRQYYDAENLKKLVYSDDSLLLVATDPGGKVLGTASVLLQVGAYSDLVGEFGRLAVHPDARGQGVGKALMAARIERVKDQLHLGLVDNRVEHEFSQRISVDFGFVPLGFIPNKMRMTKRESVALYGRFFGDAIQLRRNHPRIIPEAHALANFALHGLGLACDVIVDDQCPAYPHEDEFELSTLTTEGYASLLRIERGRVKHREIFGPMRLHYGLFKLHARHSTYLIARQQDRLVGAIGYAYDKFEGLLRIFELIAVDDTPVRFLLQQLLEKAKSELEATLIEIDVSAFATGMQRTLLELNFLPVAYIPAMVFQEVERIDAIKMLHLLAPLDVGEIFLHEKTQPIADSVLQSFAAQAIQPRVAAAMSNIQLFHGLQNDQLRRIAAICSVRKFAEGTAILRANERDEEMHLVLSGSIQIMVGEKVIATAGVGECLGESSLLHHQPHLVTAVTSSAVETAVIAPHDFLKLIRAHPDIGVVVYRNLAHGLAERLRRTDSRLADL